MSAQDLRATMLAAILAQGIPLEQAMQDAEAAVAYVVQGPPKEAAPEPSRKDRILDMWAQGMLTAAIAGAVGMDRRAVFDVVKRARKAGDLRAASRHKHVTNHRGEGLVKACAVLAAKRAGAVQ